MNDTMIVVEAPCCRSCGVAIAGLPVFMGRYAFWLCEACRTPGEDGAWRDFMQDLTRCTQRRLGRVAPWEITQWRS